MADLKQATISPELSTPNSRFPPMCYLWDLHAARPPEIAINAIHAYWWEVSKMDNRKDFFGVGVRNLVKHATSAHRSLLEGYETFQNFYRNFLTHEPDPLGDQP